MRGWVKMYSFIVFLIPIIVPIYLLCFSVPDFRVIVAVYAMHHPTYAWPQPLKSKAYSKKSKKGGNFPPMFFVFSVEGCLRLHKKDYKL